MDGIQIPGTQIKLPTWGLFAIGGVGIVALLVAKKNASSADTSTVASNAGLTAAASGQDVTSMYQNLTDYLNQLYAYYNTTPPVDTPPEAITVYDQPSSTTPPPDFYSPSRFRTWNDLPADTNPQGYVQPPHNPPTGENGNNPPMSHPPGQGPHGGAPALSVMGFDSLTDQGEPARANIPPYSGKKAYGV
jgi:hypothetical protein